MDEFKSAMMNAGVITPDDVVRVDGEEAKRMTAYLDEKEAKLKEAKAKAEADRSEAKELNRIRNLTKQVAEGSDKDYKLDSQRRYEEAFRNKCS